MWEDLFQVVSSSRVFVTKIMISEALWSMYPYTQKWFKALGLEANKFFFKKRLMSTTYKITPSSVFTTLHLFLSMSSPVFLSGKYYIFFCLVSFYSQLINCHYCKFISHFYKLVYFLLSKLVWVWEETQLWNHVSLKTEKTKILWRMYEVSGGSC